MSSTSPRNKTDHSEQLAEPVLELTSGPARFVMANDDSKDCLALLVTDTFLEKVNDMFEQDRNSRTIHGSVIQAQLDIEAIENSIEVARRSLRLAESGVEKEELQQYLDKKEPRLVKLRQWKNELDDRYDNLKLEISRSSNYAHYVLNTAMKSAKLLRQNKPLPRPDIDERESVGSPSTPPLSSPPPNKPALSPEERQRQAAYDELRDCWYHLDKIQRLFNEREYLYHEKLAEYRQDCVNGTCSISQSELDRRHLDYSMRLTGALIDAESNFERARDRADALGAGSDYSDSSCYHRYNEDTSLDNAQQAVATVDRSFIEAWRANVKDCEMSENPEVVGMDLSDDGLVDISDSMSARDCSENRKKINRWQKTCGFGRVFDQKRMNIVSIDDGLALDQRN